MMKAANTAGTLMNRKNWSIESICPPKTRSAPRPSRYSAPCATCCSAVRTRSEMAAPLIVSSARIEIIARNFMAGNVASDCGETRQNLVRFRDDPPERSWHSPRVSTSSATTVAGGGKLRRHGVDRGRGLRSRSRRLDRRFRIGREDRGASGPCRFSRGRIHRNMSRLGLGAAPGSVIDYEHSCDRHAGYDQRDHTRMAKSGRHRIGKANTCHHGTRYFAVAE